jgi:lysophospholipase L1-like esterase
MSALDKFFDAFAPTLTSLADWKTPVHGLVKYCVEAKEPYEWDASNKDVADGITRIASTDGTPGRWKQKPNTVSLSPLGASAAKVVRPNSAGSDTTIMLVGDSITWGGTGGGSTAAGFRPDLSRLLRAKRQNVRFIGTLQEARAGYFLLGDWHHEGHSGFTIEQLTIATYIAATGAPDVMMLMIGTNNISASESGATALGKLATLLDTIKTQCPSTRVFVSSIAPWVAPAASFATKQTERNTYNAGIAALCTARGENFTYVDGCAGMHGAHMGSDGIHPNKSGYELIARNYAAVLDRVLPPELGLPMPRDFSSRPKQASFSFTANGNKIVIPYGAGLKPANTGSFSVGLWLRPSSLAAGLWTIAQYGTVYTAGGYMLAINVGSVPEAQVYVHSAGAATLTTSTLAGTFAVSKWHRIWMAYDQPKAEVRLYITREGMVGHLAWVQTGVAAGTACTETADTTLGAVPGGGFNAVQGLIDGFTVCNGYAVELADIEADYYEGVLPPNATAYYALGEGTGTSVADATGFAGPAGTTTGGAWVAAGTNPKPFDE